MAKIIKRGEAKGEAGGEARRSVDLTPDEGGVVHKRVLDAREKAQKILSDADADAARIRDEAKAVLADAEVKRQEAIKKGYSEGQAKGLAQVTEKLLHVERLKEQFYDQAEPEVVKLVLEIAEKVIGRVAAENPELVRSVVRQALERVLGDRITVRLNPEDYRTLMAGDHEFRDVIDRTRRLLFREDEAIAKGGCIVETEVGTIDALIETQLEAIRKAMMA